MELSSTTPILDFFFFILLSFFVLVEDEELIYTCLDRYSKLKNSRTALTLNLFNSDAPNVVHRRVPEQVQHRVGRDRAGSRARSRRA
mgnify:CR=1 FL=1